MKKGNKKWWNILDPKVLKVGMHIKTCLDCSEPRYECDQDGEETDHLQWWEAEIVEIASSEERYIIYISTGPEGDEEIWEIDLFEGEDGNMDCILVHIQEWDE